MKYYYPYKSDRPDKKYYIITKDNKRVYFGQASASGFTIHKDEARKQRYINRHEKNASIFLRNLTLFKFLFFLLLKFRNKNLFLYTNLISFHFKVKGFYFLLPFF